ncbi:MAG: MFS transporter [Gemmatimonadota bacterium]
MRPGIRLIVSLGMVSLLADVTYEGARSVAGPFLASLGAGAVVIGIISGFGELVGYALRLASGYLADRTRRYWPIALVGYFVNLLSVPCLALAGSWPVAGTLLILERTGKGVRAPARDAILSYAARSVGSGWGFGLHEALDQVGAVLGPLVVAGILYLSGGFRSAFAWLLVPALAALSVLLLARARFPEPERLEEKEERHAARAAEGGAPAPAGSEAHAAGGGVSRRSFRLLLISMALLAAGTIDFPLIAFHFQQQAVFSVGWIPVIYAIAMAVDGIGAPFLGKVFDRVGLAVLFVGPVGFAASAPLMLLSGPAAAVVGVALWGLAIGTEQSVARAAVAELVPMARRGAGFGLFHAVIGVSWFVGSALMGWLYAHSVGGAVLASVGFQLAAAIALAGAAAASR